MNQTFIKTLQKLIADKGKKIMLYPDAHSTGSLLADRTCNEYEKERHLLLQACELGIAKAIAKAQNLELCKRQQIELLQNKRSITETAAIDVVDLLAMLLRGNSSKTERQNIGAGARKTSQPQAVAMPKPSAPQQTTQPAKMPTGSHAKVLIEAGKKCINDGDYDAAISQFSEAIRLYPDYAPGYVWRGKIYCGKISHKDYPSDLASADFLTAINLCTKVIKSNPNDPEHYRLRGEVYRDQRQYDQAIRDFSDAIRLEPENLEHYRLRGEVYRDQGQYDQVIRDLSNAIRLDPENPEHYRLRGEVYRDQEQYDQAIRDLSNAIRLDPENPEHYRLRGEVYRYQNEYSKNKGDMVYKDLMKFYKLSGETYISGEFYDLKLTSVTIPDSVISIGGGGICG